MIDPNEAPEGYYAAPEVNVCVGCAARLPYSCAFESTDSEVSCKSADRKDGHSVIFLKREDDQHPHYRKNPHGLCIADVNDALDGIKELHRLRDQFAKSALAGSQGRAMTGPQMTQAACIAYWQADAMLHAKFSTMTWGDA